MRARIILISIISVIGAALIVCTGILFFVQNTFFDSLPKGVSEIRVYGVASTELAMPPLSPNSDDSRVVDDYNEFETALNNTKFSLIVSVLSGRWLAETKFERDGEDNLVKLNKAELDALQADTDKYMVDMYWGFENIQTIKVEDKTIEFDTIKFIFGNDGDLSLIRVFAYNSLEMIGNAPTVEDTVANPFTVYASTSGLYNTVKDMIARKQ
ncbi:MAG: hypothetical protein FWF56_02140 [Firmicutes bacterium]|nr:hypothetical protein [Bacillota bacterium]MCL1954110.1 hypothetical protein [Bacillota bacterium]